MIVYGAKLMKFGDLQYKNIDRFYEVDEEQFTEAKLEDNFEDDADVEALDDHPEVLRIEGRVRRTWSGVRSCQKRGQGEVQRAFDNWVTAQRQVHSELRYLRSGPIGDVSFSYRNIRSSGGKRRCNGWTTFKVFIEFVE